MTDGIQWNRVLDIYLSTASGKTPAKKNMEKEKSLHIGRIAKQAGISASAIRHYVKQGVIAPTGHSEGGFALFSSDAAARIKEIKRLQQEERLSIAEIKRRLS